MLKLWLSLFLVIVSLNTYAQITYHANQFTTNAAGSAVYGEIYQSSASGVNMYLSNSVRNTISFWESSSATYGQIQHLVNGFTLFINGTNSPLIIGALQIGTGNTIIGPDSSFYSTNFVGNAGNLTNFNQLTYTNSSSSYLAPNTFSTVPSFGLLACSVVTTNAVTVYLTNATTHLAIPMGSSFSVGTNYSNTDMFVKPGDSVCITNLAGTGGYNLISSTFQGVH